MTKNRLNAYQNMWMFVLYDLPVTSSENQKIAQKFRQNLLRDGFTMLQFSVYVRHCVSNEKADMHRGRVLAYLPPKGRVSIMRITDKQYGSIEHHWGAEKPPSKESPRQLMLF